MLGHSFLIQKKDDVMTGTIPSDSSSSHLGSEASAVPMPNRGILCYYYVLGTSDGWDTPGPRKSLCLLLVRQWV